MKDESFVGETVFFIKILPPALLPLASYLNVVEFIYPLPLPEFIAYFLIIELIALLFPAWIIAPCYTAKPLFPFPTNDIWALYYWF